MIELAYKPANFLNLQKPTNSTKHFPVPTARNYSLYANQEKPCTVGHMNYVFNFLNKN